MTDQSHIHPADLRGLSRLAVEATLGLTDLVECMHDTIARTPALLDMPAPARTRGITGLVYQSIRGITHLVGDGLDLLLALLTAPSGQRRSSPQRDAVLATLNGVLGDHLVASHNPLATPMQLWRDGQALEPTGPGLSAAITRPGGKILLLIHGLCLNEQHWWRDGHDHGALLAAELGYTQVYLRYNTGLHISTNGHTLAGLIEALLQSWPVLVEELAIIGHSMGGLVARSACHYGMRAGHAWPRQLRAIVFLGTPHHGAPLERVGSWVHALLGVSPYTAAFARLGEIRSAGITDLRHGSLLGEDWADHDRFLPGGDQRRPVPLPTGVSCYAIGATTGKTADDLRGQLLGDGLVPLSSALGYHLDASRALPFAARWVGYDMHHLDLLRRRDVYEQLRGWLAP